MKFYLLLLLSSARALSPLNNGEKRIINGTDAKRHQFPYIVSLNNGTMNVCGGSIVSRTWVISAGHCFEKQHNIRTPILAIAGLLKQNEIHPDIQKIPISKAILHPGFIHDDEKLLLQNDIALVNLAQALIFSMAVQPIGLPQPNQKFSGKVWLCGWGQWTIPKIFPMTLQYLAMNIISNKECQDVRTKYDVYPQFKIYDHMICTTPFSTNPKSTACHGDSGGPLVQNGTLIGIVSFSDAPCKMEAEIPTNVFTRVSSFIEFINTHVKDLA